MLNCDYVKGFVTSLAAGLGLYWVVEDLRAMFKNKETKEDEDEGNEDNDQGSEH